jgi:hypothetical protein
MSAMKPLIVLPSYVLVILALAGPLPGTGDYTQSYAILIKGAVAGTETVAEKAAGSDELVSTSEHEILVTDGLETKRMAFTTRMALSKSSWTPVSYSCRYTSGGSEDSYEVVIMNDQVTRTLSRGGRTSEVTVPFQQNMVILDFSVYHQYDYVIRKYDLKRGGRQLFADFVPVIGNDIPLALTLLGNEELQLKTGTVSVRNFSVEFVGIWSGTLSADMDGRLVHLSIPAQDLEVVRRDLLPSDHGSN